MNGFLFNPPTVDSPRLAWMKRHGVKTIKVEGELRPGEEDEFGNYVFDWYCSGATGHQMGGETEDEAIAAWARSANVRLWNGEGYK